MSEPEVTISLQEITKETLRSILNLKVSEDQAAFVASNAVSIAEAYFSPDIAWFRAIYADDRPVGFLMLEDDPAHASYFLWRFMIDEQFQRHGYGRRALALLVEHVKTRPSATALLTSHVSGEGSAGRFYEKVGFVYTGETDQDDLIMRLDL